MARSVHHQSDFLGGEWSPLAQGRDNDPFYHRAMNVCRNGQPVEEGAWTRRSGTEVLGPTFNRGEAKLLGFSSSSLTPYVMEFSNTILKLWYGAGPVCTSQALSARPTITASSSSGGTITATATAHGLTVNDRVLMWFPAAFSGLVAGPYKNRTFNVHSVAGPDTLTLRDDMDNVLPFDGATNELATAKLFKLLRFDNTGIVTAALENLRAVQAENNAVILSSLEQPKVVTVTVDQSGDIDPTITYQAVVFSDGPYLDPQPGGGTVSAATGTITFTPSDGSTFVANDVGRMIRLFSEPAAWDAGTTYAAGTFVSYPSGEWWVCVYGGLSGVVPGTSTLSGTTQIVPWAPAPTAGQWAWGLIQTQATTSCTVALVNPLNANNGLGVSIWRLGIWTGSTWPTCGLYHEGRLWLGTANRFDGSVSNDSFNFAPTDVNGNVLDSSAIDYTLNFDDITKIDWMKPDHQGILMGTAAGEVLVSASQLSDPLTPTSIQAKKVSELHGADVESVRISSAVIFVQRYTRRLMEMFAEAYTGLFGGRHLNEFAKHLTEPGISEIDYQEETVPTLWARIADGSLIGATYRRMSRFITEPPVYTAWHRHDIGNGAVSVTGIRVASDPAGLSDRLYLVTEDANGHHWVEIMRPLFEDP